MTHKNSRVWVAASGVTVAAFALAIVPLYSEVDARSIKDFPQPSSRGEQLHDAAPLKVDPLERTAHILQDRIERRYHVRPSIETLKQAIVRRRELMSTLVTVQFQSGEDPAAHPDWLLSPSHNPEWVRFSMHGSDVTFTLDGDAVRKGITEADVPTLPAAVNATAVAGEPDSYGVRRVTMEGTPSDGYWFDREKLTTRVIDAFASDDTTLAVPVVQRDGVVTYSDGQTTKDLVSVGLGKSSFLTSSSNRIFNIRKALGERINNVVVPAGSTFSFNSMLGTPITTGKGWKEELGIFEGWDLRPTPGGGICQTATTFYRSVLMAGLPVVKRKNHSLFVHYYVSGGAGLDATIFPGAQDLSFVNDTGNDLVVRAWWDDDKNAYVSLYGIPDGRSSDVVGPYFAANPPQSLPADKTLRGNQIAWERILHRSDGTSTTETIISTYKSIPKAVFAEFATPSVLAY